jgi:hypothetical protein
VVLALGAPAAQTTRVDADDRRLPVCALPEEVLAAVRRAEAAKAVGYMIRSLERTNRESET